MELETHKSNLAYCNTNTIIMKLNLLAQAALLTIAAACECGSTHECHKWRRPGPGDRKASLPYPSHLTLILTTKPPTNH
jgi:hypothetical protein